MQYFNTLPPPLYYKLLIYVDTPIHSYLQYVDYSTAASAIKGTNSTSLGQIDATQLYNLQVVCNISPTSTADYCEVFVYGPDSVTGKYYMYSICSL